MTSAEVAGDPAASLARDMRDAAPAALVGGTLCAAAVAALGQVPPLLVNLAGGELAITTQVRLGWLYAMAGHAVAIEATGLDAAVDGAASDEITVRLGMLTIAAFAIWVLALAARGTARRVDDSGPRRALAGSLVAVPYALLVGGVNAAVQLRLRTGGGLLPEMTSFRAPAWEGFVLPGAIALVVCALAGWSVSSASHGAAGTALRAGLAAFGWAVGLAFVGVLVFAAVRPEGLERYSVEVTSAGSSRTALYVGHQVLSAPNQAVWILSPSMGACDTLRVDGRPQDVLCLDRIPRGDDPATWFLSELGRKQGSSPVAPMPSIALLFLLVPASAIVLGVRRVGRRASSAIGAAAIGAGAGAVFAATVTMTSLAGSLWVGLRSGEEVRTVAMGPDPLRTGLLALVWGVIGGAVVAVAGCLWNGVSRRGRPR
ncbi:MAG: hypothetical protein ACXWZF_10135 [Actinomycetota bacterium]